MTDAERIARLEEEVAYLRRELGLSRSADHIALMRAAKGFEPAQTKLLLRLYRAHGRTLTREQLAEELGEETDPKCLRSHFSRIRRLRGCPWIETVHGVGYRMTSEGLAAIARILGDELLRAA